MLENSSEDKSELSVSAGLPLLPAQGPVDRAKSSGSAARFTRNAALSVGRLMITTLVALVLPAFLTHKLPSKTYSAWVLILQMSAYVSYLDFGVQSGVAKFVAEYEAKGDALGATRRASAGLAIMLATSILGMILTTILAWQVPHFFSQMPPDLYRDVRISLILVGGSLSFGLLCSVFSAIFVGLQRYGVPMGLAVVNRILFTAVICVSAYRNSSLAMMGAAVAIVNVLTGLLQVAAWYKLAGRIRVSFGHVRPDVLKKMLAYCSVLAIWSAGMLCVTGLDVTIVGRYDFSQTGFYSIATLPTSFMIAILGAALGPLLPSGSAMSTIRTPEEMGDLVTRATRYSTLLLLLTGLPLLVGAYPILRLWIGPGYALHTMGYLRILVAANILRAVCSPYSTMLVATDSQRVAIAGAMAEAIVNVASSVYLARHLGAIGVAYGTVLGSLVSVLMHFAVSMRLAYAKLAVSRSRLFFGGMLRPSLVALPTLALLPSRWSTVASTMSPLLWVVWALSTVLLAWFAALTLAERRSLIKLARDRMKLAASYS